jgi:2,4-dienoyl-CoA reductase-like NADH-dependent reductase (Old Yellow Enzyme family)/thioredoxin reductase
MNYNKVFEPLRIGKLTAKNRIEVSPAEPFLATKDGMVTDEFVAFTASMAKGGSGIVTVGDSPVTKEYAEKNHYVINLSDPLIVHGLIKLTDAIHRYGALASIELNLREEYILGDMTKEEIKGIIKAFADAAERCKKGGFDLVMIHAGHGHVIANFMSPTFNKRQDEYGCDTIENRCRFPAEIIDAVRRHIGDDMAIELRVSGDELTEGGVGLEDALQNAKYLESRIDMIHVSVGNLYNVASISRMIQPAYLPMATNVAYAERFKQELNIPVVTVGSFNMPLAEKALAEGKADMVAMIRAFIADPDQVNKAKAGKADEIRPCIRCSICTGDDPHGCPKPLRCSVNAVSGRNQEFSVIPKAEKPKKVLIIGGGCAGMEAARRLAERGHHPVLFEQQPSLGGSLIAAGANAIKGDVKRYFEWSVRMTHKTKEIDVRLGITVTEDIIKAEQPDAVIIAVGSEPIIPNLPGINGKNVVLAQDVDMDKATCGKNVILAGAGLTGTETAVTLARDGHKVTVIDMLTLAEIDAKGNASASIIRSIRKLAAEEGIIYLERHRLTEVHEGGIICLNAASEAVELSCDTLVLSLGVKPRENIVRAMKDLVAETIVIGDCSNRNGNITSAVREGFYAAMNI